MALARSVSQVRISESTASIVACNAGPGGITPRTFSDCTCGGIVGASVIATSSQPRSHVIRQRPRSAFSASMAAAGRHAPCRSSSVGDAGAPPVRRLVEEQVVGRDAFAQRRRPSRTIRSETARLRLEQRG